MNRSIAPARPRLPLRSLLCLAAVTTMMSGCDTLSGWGSSMSAGLSSVSSWVPGFLNPYRPDVHQGNIITKEMVDQLRIGMTREQVRFMLGTPLMTSEFHKNRIDYIYYLNPRRGAVQIRRLSLYFANNRLERFTADEMPSEEVADILILGPNARRAPRNSNVQPQTPQTMPDVTTPVPGSTD